ncbi:hypothetical protein CEXT_72741 [Caerostris extrusa]|uniref:Uncharacterized protein n=1 Tax=Caerostris extrusa TaxID=172846 RepID=A0AAV4TR50_CAEEX|nr:hypothetical protein CEXT_72741 [Caerostris extrusa]
MISGADRERGRVSACSRVFLIIASRVFHHAHCNPADHGRPGGHLFSATAGHKPAASLSLSVLFSQKPFLALCGVIF